MMTESDLSSPTSTSSFGDLSPKKMEDKANYRKSNKPMMEKKRRARINSCLTQLKTLVLEAMKKDNSQYSKLEKADILELTVKHLKNVQRYQGNGVTQLPDAISKYRAGFNECANEVMRYLGDSQGVNDEARTRILSHLASILTPLNNLPLQQGHNAAILPALAPAQHHQQQQIHLHQLQHQHQNSIFVAPSSAQVLGIDTNNNQPAAVMQHSVYRSQNGNTVDIKNVISHSPTAFQTPIHAGAVGGPVGLQIPCMEAAQFQLVPSASGQVALVLTPQAIPAVNLYARQQLGRLPSSQPQQQANLHCDHMEDTGAISEDSKSGLASDSKHVAIKTSKLHRSHDAPASRSYEKSVPPTDAPRPESAQSSSPSPYDLRQIYTADRMAFTSASLNKVSANVIAINSLDNNGNNNNNGGNFKNSNIVRATSTWRPW